MNDSPPPPRQEAAITCYRHPDREYAVRCQRCERPICRECAVPASVGFHCRECVQSSGQKIQRGIPSSDPVMTYGIMAICIGIFVAQQVWNSPDPDELNVTRLLILHGPDVAAGELWRVVTSAFIHANVLHIGFNMYVLYALGPMLERGMGKAFFLLCYLGGALTASLAVLLFNFQVSTLGASGAVLGMAGALAVVLHRRGVSLRQTNLLGLIGINLALPVIVGGISFWGHFGGIAGGALAAFVQLVAGETGTRSRVAGVALSVALVAACAAVASMGGLR